MAVEPGDLYLEVLVLDHPAFERRGDDLHCTLNIPMTAAALGASVSLELLDGVNTEVDIRPGTQAGQQIPLLGQGVPQLRGGGRGDVIVHVSVETPTRLDDEQTATARHTCPASWRREAGWPVRRGTARVLLAPEGRVQRPVSLPVFYLSSAADAVVGSTVVLDGPEGHHAATVRRLRVGEQVVLTDGEGAALDATITSVGRREVSLAVTAARVADPASVELCVVQAIAKGDRAERAVELLTEVGVDVIVPWQAERCISRWARRQGRSGKGQVAGGGVRGGQAVAPGAVAAS